VTEKDVEDDRLAVADRNARDVLEISRLRGRELGVEHEHRGAAGARPRGYVLGSAFAQKRSWIWLGKVKSLPPNDATPLAPHEGDDLGHLGRPRPGIARRANRDDVNGVGRRRLLGIASVRRLPLAPVGDERLEPPLVRERHFRVLRNGLRSELQHVLPFSKGRRP